MDQGGATIQVCLGGFIGVSPFVECQGRPFNDMCNVRTSLIGRSLPKWQCYNAAGS